jgi:signal peptidase I
MTTSEKRGTDRAAKRTQSGFGETLKTLAIALAIALLIRTFLVQAFRIPSGSMEDTLLVGDFLLVDKVTFGAKIPFTDTRLPGLRKPRRGDILVFKDPRTDRDYIKRCVAVGGETLLIRNDQLFIDGKPLEEPYKVLKHYPGPSKHDFGPQKIVDSRLFMMGDNRNNSQDSRYWDALKPDRVVGRAFVLYWSVDPMRAPRFVQEMSETWVKGLLQLVLGQPRIRRVGTWLAHDWRPVYAKGIGLPSAAAAATPTSADRTAGADSSGAAATNR